MFRDTANTREGWQVFSTILFGVMAAFWWAVGIAPWLVVLPVFAFLAGIYSLISPRAYELIVDDTGVCWGRVGKTKRMKFLWPDIRGIRYVRVERELHLDVGRIVLVTIPTYFLRSEDKQGEFLSAVSQFSPRTAIERL